MKVEFNKSFEIAKSNEENIYKIEGVATEYGVIDKTGELFKDGSFDESVGEVVPIMVRHAGTFSTVGTATIVKDGSKLLMEGELFEHTELGKSIALAKSKGVKYNLSIGGIRKEYNWEDIDDKSTLVVTKGEIREVSIIEKDRQAHQSAIVTKKLNTEKEESMTKQEIMKMLGVTEEQLEKLASTGEIITMEQIEKNLGSKFEGFEKKLEEANKLIKELGNSKVENSEELAKEYEENMEKFLTTSMDSPEYNEVKKALMTTNTGAVLLPVLKSKDIIKTMREESPVYMNSRVVNITKGNGFGFKVLDYANSTNNAKTQTEGAAAGTSSETKFKLVEVKLETITDKQEVTQEMTDGTIENVQSIIYEVAGDNISEQFGDKIWRGTGTVKGITLNTEAVAAAAVSSASGKISADDVINLAFDLKPKERRRGAYYASTGAMKVLRTLKDTTGAYLFTPALANGTPATFNGYKLYEDPYMDDVAAGKFPICFANMKKFYPFVQMRGITLEKWRDGDKNQDILYTRFRVGADVAQIKSGKLLKVKA